MNGTIIVLYKMDIKCDCLHLVFICMPGADPGFSSERGSEYRGDL